MNKRNLLFIGLLFVTLFLFIISALSDIGTPTPLINTSNLTGATAYLNASLLDTPIVVITNVTFSYQPWLYQHNTSWLVIGTVSNTTGDQATYNRTWDTTSIPDGQNYTINVTSMNFDGTYNTTNLTGNITIDNTAPTLVVYGGAALTVYANGTSIKTNSTLTGSLFPNNLTLNISVTDATVGLLNSSNQFCFINIGGGANHSVPLTANRWCNSSDINITGLSEGNTTINIYINDTLSVLRLNSTLVVQVDTVDPTSTASCSPTTVTTGDSFPCTCTTTDATSAINSASSGGTSTSPDGTATPSSTGTFTYTCSATDNGGLTSSATKTYSVTQTPGSGPSGGSSGTTTTFWTKGTVSVSDAQFEGGYTNQVSAKQRLKVSVNNQNHYVGVKSMTTSTVTIEVSSTPQEATLSIGDERKFDVDDDSNYDIFVKLNSIIDNKANLTIQELDEPVTVESTTGEEEKEEGAQEEREGDLTKALPWWAWVIIMVVVLVILGEAVRRNKKFKF